MSYAVKLPSGAQHYFNRKMCGVYDSPLKLAEAFAERTGGILMAEDQGKYNFMRDGKPLRPRWRPLR